MFLYVCVAFQWTPGTKLESYLSNSKVSLIYNKHFEILSLLYSENQSDMFFVIGQAFWYVKHVN